MIPFPGVRYHLQDWTDAGNKPVTAKELYNLRHTRIRVVVKQAFRQLKRQWKIVRFAPFEYSVRKQVQIVYTVTGLHNFIIAIGGSESPTQEESHVLQRAAERASQTIRVRPSNNIRYTTALVM